MKWTEHPGWPKQLHQREKMMLWNSLSHHIQWQAAAFVEITKMLKKVIGLIAMRWLLAFFHKPAKCDPVHCKYCISQWMGRSIEVIDDLLARI